MKKSKSVIVVGAGIAGIQAALDLAEMGAEVHLVEQSPSIGGRIAVYSIAQDERMRASSGNYSAHELLASLD